MKNRSNQKLIASIKKIWEKIKSSYEEGNICSERHLQAEFYKYLSDDKSLMKQHKIFIEPTLDGKEIKHIKGTKPDIIIANKTERKIIAVIELKYMPHGSPDCGDIMKLFQYKKVIGGKVYLETNYKTGEWEKKENRLYEIDKKLLLVFAVFAWHDSYALKSDVWKHCPSKNKLHLTRSIG